MHDDGSIAGACVGSKGTERYDVRVRVSVAHADAPTTPSANHHGAALGRAATVPPIQACARPPRGVDTPANPSASTTSTPITRVLFSKSEPPSWGVRGETVGFQSHGCTWSSSGMRHEASRHAEPRLYPQICAMMLYVFGTRC